MNDSFENIKNIEELSNYMYNIKYGYITKDKGLYFPDNPNYEKEWLLSCVVQTGEEVKKTKIGTCWDQVELERLWFDKNNFNFKTFFIWFGENRDIYPTHTFLVFKQNNDYYWFENVFEQYRGIHKFSSFEKLIESVKKGLLDYSISIGIARITDYKLLRVYEYSSLNSSLSVTEYLKHVTKNEINEFGGEW